MEVLLVLIKKLIPLYCLIGLGYGAGRKLKLEPETIGALLLYIVSPLVFFHGTATMAFRPAALLLPFVVYLTACSVSLVTYRLGRWIWPHPTPLRNLAAFTAGTGNTGYFGIPVVLMVFGEGAVGFAVLFIIGTVLFENTLGFYFAARGNFSSGESLHKVLRLPTVYAFILGILFSYAGFQLPSALDAVFLNIRGAYSFLGMLLIGLALSQGKLEPDRKFMQLSFLAKFVAWPIIISAFASLDSHQGRWIPLEVWRVALLLSAVPLAANTVVVATLLRSEPRKISFAVLVSTLVSLLSVPLMATYGFFLLAD